MPQEVYGVLSIVMSIVFIALAWWALQSFRFEKIVKHPQGRKPSCCKFFCRS